MSNPVPPFQKGQRLKLHLGGWEVKPGWLIVNVEDRPGVDVRSSVTDLSMFPDESAVEVYASHVYEHLGYHRELRTALREAWRVLMPGGVLRVAVPDLEVLCQLYTQTRDNLDAQFEVQRMIMGGQTEPHDFHKTGFSLGTLVGILTSHGFTGFRRVDDFGLFKDTSTLVWGGVPISLNVQCTKDGKRPPLPIPDNAPNT